ncbi:hypothetical protein PRUPE_1G084100 [Prunus persica]|uniref:Uncharacterized protein n=1 Tax=Prunus persica TaxID=3760 RepID=A0A251QUG9_PRUPE|nr:hypothetical protein PRUPE_1G084100 [Prunus persica]
MKYREKMVNFVRRLKAKMKRTMMLILKRLPFHFPEHRINDLPEPSLQVRIWLSKSIPKSMNNQILQKHGGSFQKRNALVLISYHAGYRHKQSPLGFGNSLPLKS